MHVAVGTSKQIHISQMPTENAEDASIEQFQRYFIFMPCTRNVYIEGP